MVRRMRRMQVYPPDSLYRAGQLDWAERLLERGEHKYGAPLIDLRMRRSVHSWYHDSRLNPTWPRPPNRPLKPPVPVLFVSVRRCPLMFSNPLIALTEWTLADADRRGLTTSDGPYKVELGGSSPSAPTEKIRGYAVTSNSSAMPSVKCGAPSGSSPLSSASGVAPTGMKHTAAVRPSTRSNVV